MSCHTKNCSFSVHHVKMYKSSDFSILLKTKLIDEPTGLGERDVCVLCFLAVLVAVIVVTVISIITQIKFEQADQTYFPSDLFSLVLFSLVNICKQHLFTNFNYIQCLIR